jgi:outer membrane protein OmpA-like peptidoglycan-associated protein
VTELGNYQFWVSNSLTSVVLPKNLTVLRQYVFGNMASLNSVTIPIGLGSIEANAFAAVPSLTSYTYCGSKLSSANLSTGGLGSKTRNCIAPQIALSRTTENVSANTAVSGYTVTSPNSFGGGVVDYSISPNISTTPGLSFDTATGLISGTPTTVAAAQTYTISANNFASPSGTATYTITVSSATPPPSIPVPAPVQRSQVRAITPDSALAGKATPIVISGRFLERIENISINGELLSPGSWSQDAESISLTIPKGAPGTYSIALYNGSEPLLTVPKFTYKGPTDLMWSLQKAPNKNAWNSIAFGNGTFVAVGPSTNGDGVMRSTDGKNWIASNGVPNNNWSSVTYGNGIFVAVATTGVGNRAMWSKDGATWTTSASFPDLNWGMVKYGNGVFVAVVKGQLRIPTAILYSTDGVTWKSPDIKISGIVIPGQSVTSLNYANGMFIITGTPGRSALGWLPLLMVSQDGINWSWNGANIGTSTEVAFQTYGCETHIAISGITGFINSAKNPLRWVRADYPANPFAGARKTLNAGTFAGSLFLTVGNGTSTLSNNALYWREQVLRSSNNWSSVVYGNGVFVAVANVGADERVMSAPFSPISLSRTDETITLGSSIAGTTPQFDGCTIPKYSIAPSISGSGLSFDSTTGRLSGTPTSAAATTYTISLEDGSDVPAFASYKLTVTAPAGQSANAENSNSESSTSQGASAPSASTGPAKDSSSNTSGSAITPSVGESSTATSESKVEAITVAKPIESPTVQSNLPLTFKVYFDMASHKLIGVNHQRAREFAAIISELGEKVSVSVIGYAQPTPLGESTDGALSARRATYVAQLLKKLGVSAEIASKGAGRAKANIPSSRYVEITVTTE